ncbi:MAG: CoA-binding protein [Dehalococcoidia bacterium]
MDASLRDILETAFHPESIAVAGASEDPLSFGHQFFRHLLDYGYTGQIYPVNPNKESIFGLKAYPNLTSIPGKVDYVICCLPASMVLDMLNECPAKGVKIVHLVTARLSETGRREAVELEAEMLKAARRLNIRLIGPNCMGIYYPRGRIANGYNLPREAGNIGAVFQSGGSSTMLIRYAELRGLRFSKVISYGNALDIDESDFLNYLAQDDETDIIAAYFEGVKDGRKFLNALSDTARIKPVIAIKGGRGLAGSRAVTSHTAAIAGSMSVWETVFKKAGVIPAQDLSELVDLLVAFSFLPPITGYRVGIMSAGGGLSVISADVCEEAGLKVPPMPAKIREELKIKAPEIWDWIGNPIDISIMGAVSVGFAEILKELPRLIAGSPDFDFLIGEFSDDNPFLTELWSGLAAGQTEMFINLYNEKLKPMIAIVHSEAATSDLPSYERWKILAEQRARYAGARIPTYSTVAEAARAVRKFIDYCRAKAER